MRAERWSYARLGYCLHQSRALHLNLGFRIACGWSRVQRRHPGAEDFGPERERSAIRRGRMLALV